LIESTRVESSFRLGSFPGVTRGNSGAGGVLGICVEEGEGEGREHGGVTRRWRRVRTG